MHSSTVSAVLLSLSTAVSVACAGDPSALPVDKVPGPPAGTLAGTEWVVIPVNSEYTLYDVDIGPVPFTVPFEYHVMTTEITGQLWNAVDGGSYQGVGLGDGQFPRWWISWDAVTGGTVDADGRAVGGWLAALNDEETDAGRTDYWYLLPTEKQWQAAARGKTTNTATGADDWCRTNQSVGDATDDVDITAASLVDYAVFDQPVQAGPPPIEEVGGKLSCGGLFDAFGNVAEWTNTMAGAGLVAAGGDVAANAHQASHALRSSNAPSTQTRNGIRLIRVARATLPPNGLIVDGVLSPGEWAQAAYTFGPIDVNLPSGQTTTATIFVTNDATDLYVAVTFDQDLSSFNTHTLAVRLDENPVDGEWNLGADTYGDDGFTVQHTAFGIRRDRFFDSHFNCGPFDNPAAPCQGQTDVEWNGTNDGLTAVGNDGATTVIEMSHPLNSGDTRDAVLTPGQSFGLLIFTNVGGPVTTAPLVRTDLVPAWATVVVQ